MSARQQSSEREQLDLFRALPGDLAPRDTQDLMAYPFFALGKSKRLAPINFKTARRSSGTVHSSAACVPSRATWSRTSGVSANSSSARQYFLDFSAAVATGSMVAPPPAAGGGADPS